MNSNITNNELFSDITRFYDAVLPAVVDRRQKLIQRLANGDFDKIIKYAGRYAQRQPSLHVESGLLARVKHTRWRKYVRQFESPKGFQFEENLKKAETLMSSSATGKFNKRQLIAATVRVFNACKFPKTKFTPVTVEYAAENQINKQSSSGFPFYTRKGHIIDKIITSTKEMFLGNFKAFNWPITRGFRLQLRLTPVIGILNNKIRVMYPYPGDIILAEDTFIMNFVNHFINNETFYIIGKNGAEISNMIRKKFNVSGIKRITSSDISAFDQNVLNELSILAFSILRKQLRLTSQEHKVFVEIVKYFCTSLAVSKSKGSPAYGFIKTHGVPSGSGFTNMIDTLVHAIVLEYAVPGVLSQERSLICGDDNLFDTSDLNYNEVVSTFNDLHLPISLDKTKHFKSWQNVSFLGFQWTNGVRLQDPYLLINQMLWHTNYRTDLDKEQRELARAASVLLNAKNGQDMFKDFFPDVMEKLTQGVDVRFFYLFGTQPPTMLPGVTGYVKVKKHDQVLPSYNQSLLLHLQDGWLIR